MSGDTKVDKPCEDCGVLMVNVSPCRKYCYACAKKRQRAYQREYAKVRKKKRHAQGVKPMEQLINPNKKYCKGCIYWGGAYEGYETCNYIFIEKHSRPCPPGKDCTEKITGKRKHTMEFGENRE